MKKKLMVFITLLFVGISLTMAQGRKVIGSVISSEDNEPIAGASIQVKGTKIGTITNSDGQFTLFNVPSTAKVLVISYIGMKTVEVTIRSNVQVVMESANKQLDEVVVTAQGLSRKEKSLGYSTQKITSDKLTIARQTDLGQALAGKIAGARFFSASGATFDSGTIVLRGTTGYMSTSGSEPIFVVDGSITNKSSVNMDDVESINVLKGPAATALYGYQGANGAVIITTKKAQEGRGMIEVSHTIQMETYYNHFDMQKDYGGGSAGLYGEAYDAKYGSKYDTMSPEFLYGTLTNTGGKNSDGSYYMDYGHDECWGARFDKNVMMASALYYDSTSSKYHQADPWQSQLKLADLYHTGWTNTTNVAFSKAGKDYNIRVSFTNSARTGIAYNSSALRHYLGIKTFFKPTDFLNVSLDYKYTYRRDHNPHTEGYGTAGNVLYDFLQWGQNNVNIKDYKDYQRPDGTWRTWNIVNRNNFTANSHDNPYASLMEKSNRSTYQWNVFTADVEALLPYKIKAGFRAIGNFRNYDGYSKTPQVSQTASFATGAFSTSSDYVRDLTLQGRLTWGDRFINDRLSVDAAAFIEQRNYNYGSVSGNTNNGLAIPGWYNLAATKGYVGASNSYSQYKTRSIFGTVTVGFDDTYFLDGSLRNDWSSTLPTKNNSYMYGGLSGSVLMNKFFKDARWLDFWKLRASMAQVGSTLGAYATNYTFSLGTKYNTMVTLTYPNSQLNQNIKPTISTSYEIGTEFRMFDNRFWGDINLYQRDTKNQIIYAPVSPQSGYAYQQINAGLVRNKGIEVSLGFTPLKTKDFQWDIDGNISKNKNKLVKLNGTIKEFMLEGNSFSAFWYVKSIVGHPMGELTTMQRMDRNEKGLPILYKSTSNYWGGGYGINNTAGTEKYVGNYQPKWTGGFSTSVRYKDFRLGASFDYMIGGQMVTWTNLWAEGSGMAASTSWKNANGVNIREGISKGGGVPIHGVDEDGNVVDCYMNAYAYYHTITDDLDQWVKSRTYLKLREVSLLYNIPTSLLAKANVGISQASVAFIATNPWLIYSAIKNVDPSETSSNWLEGGQAPSTRQFGVTVKLTF
jgi:TonB-linked SusC/RagA family outer membrane protein